MKKEIEYKYLTYEDFYKSIGCTKGGFTYNFLKYLEAKGIISKVGRMNPRDNKKGRKRWVYKVPTIIKLRVPKTIESQKTFENIL